MNTKPIFNHTRFDQIFTEATTDKVHAPAPYRDCFKDTQYMKNGKTRQMNVYRLIGPLCMIRNGGGYAGVLYIKPAEDVLKWILENMIQVKYDTISFEIIKFDDGQAAVYAQFGQILGQWLLAVIDSGTIPS